MPNKQNIRKQELIMQQLNEKPMSRSELMRRTGIKRTTLYDGLSRLEINKKIRRYAQKLDGPGRPEIIWAVVKI